MSGRLVKNMPVFIVPSVGIAFHVTVNAMRYHLPIVFVIDLDTIVFAQVSIWNSEENGDRGARAYR